MPDVCLYFQVHQPNRLKPYTFFDIGNDPFYEDDELNREVLSEVCDRCYLPANHLFTDLIEAGDGKVKINLSLTGVFLEQLQHHRPDVLASFQDLVATGGVELLAETYYHSLSFRSSREEFVRQVKKHGDLIEELFGQSPTVFRHTELIYFNELAAQVEQMGYTAQLAEGVGRVLQGRSPNHLYQAPNVATMKTILRNNELSDDVSFRFADSQWNEYPLSPEKHARWVQQSGGDVCGIFLDYETIGEHIHRDQGIFQFWGGLPAALAAEGCHLLSVSEVAAKHEVAGIYDCHLPTSWADKSKDLGAWKSNPMQLEARAKIHSLEKAVKAHRDPDLLHQWAKMQTSDHFYYMFTGEGEDREVHNHFSPYETPYDGYLYFMNALSDLQVRLG